MPCSWIHLAHLCVSEPWLFYRKLADPGALMGSWLSWKFLKTVFYWESRWDCYRSWTSAWALLVMLSLLRASFPTPEVRKRGLVPLRDETVSQNKSKQKKPYLTVHLNGCWSLVEAGSLQWGDCVLTLEHLWECTSLSPHKGRQTKLSIPCKC